jgi:sugar phosphate isomerase/epimerase
MSAATLGTTLYSLTNEWRARRYTLEGLIERVAAAGLGPGLELVGFQSIRGFPQLDESFVRDFRALVERCGLQPTALGANIDVALRSDRLMTTEECVEYLTAQIEAARRLGFPVLRIQIGATPEVLERVAPSAERAGVRLGMEIHAPEGGDSPRVLAIRECFDRIGSPFLGFIPDFSSTMTAVPRGQLAAFERAGLPSTAVELLVEEWGADGPPHERYERFAEGAAALGAPADAIASARIAFTMFGTRAPETWREILPAVVHVHAKFYELDDDGEEPSIPHGELLGLLRDAGYDGAISSEWEGHAWADAGEADAIELLKGHHALCHRHLGAARA